MYYTFTKNSIINIYNELKNYNIIKNKEKISLLKYSKSILIVYIIL